MIADKIFQVTNTDAVKFIPKRDNPNVIFTGFSPDDGAHIPELKRLEDALIQVQDHAVTVCVNRKGLRAQHKFKPLQFARTRKGIELQIYPDNTLTTIIIMRDGRVVVPPFAAFNELTTVGRYEAAVGRAIELLML